MNSSSKINSPPKSRSTSNIINNIHTMSWLKQDLPSLDNSKPRNLTVGKDGEILSIKKTNEDYFAGTRREEKKNKKKKEKKGKSGVVIANLQDLVSLTQQNEKRSTSVEDSKEILIHNQPIVEKEVEIESEINTTADNGTVWSNTYSTADKLFHNVESVRIDRFEEEEMLSRAIAESIATVQLEQFKRPSPDKENRWEALYGDFEDEGSWDNVKRNLPTEPETTNSGGEASGQRKSRDDNNNSPRSGILRNKQTNLNRYSIAPEEHDFCFKTSSESSKDDLERAQSMKSVSFNESVVVKVRSSESSESDVSDMIIIGNKKGPNIDKYGRVDGYSERRLFMGKGARIREQEYIQNQCSLGVKDLDSESNSKATTINKTQELYLTAPQCTKNVQLQQPCPNLENPKSEKAIAVNNNLHKTSETRIQKSESNPQATAIVRTHKPALKSVPNFKNPKSAQAIAVNNFHKTPETKLKTEKPALNTAHSPRNLQSQKSIPHFKNHKTEKAIAVKNIHRTPETSKDIKRDERGERNVEIPNESVKKSPGNRPVSDIASNTMDVGSSSDQKLDSHEEEQRGKTAEIKDVKDLREEILSEDMISKKFTTVLETPDDESDSGGPCLVPTLVRQDGYTPNLFTSNFQYTESMSAISEVESQSPACQNLLLAGVSCQDAKRDAQSFMPHYSDPKDFQRQNYCIFDSVSSLQSQCGNQIYQNPLIYRDAYSTIPNYAKMNETDSTYFMHRLTAGNFPYQNACLRPDPDHRSDSNFTERGETGLPSTNTEYLEPITDLHKAPAHEKTDNDRRLFSTAQAPPGFIKNLRPLSGLIKNLQLPSGFTRKESTQRCGTEEKNSAINSPAVSQKARVAKSEKVQSNDKQSLGQNRPGYYEKNSRAVQTNSEPSKKHQNFHKPQTADSDREKSPLTENRKVPYPILGANQHSDEKNSDSQRVESKTSQSSKSRRDAVNNRSPNTRENSRRPNPNNNNYLVRSTQNTNLDLNRQEMNDSLQNSQSGVPVMYQMPDRLSPGSSNVSNWQYNVNIMNLPQVPMNFSPYHQMPMPNAHDLLENNSPDYLHAAIHPNGGFHQLPMHVYPIPYLMNTGVTDAQTMRLENTGSPEMNSVVNRDYLMQRSTIGDNYSPDETSVGQFMPNSNFYETQTMPSMADAWNMQNNQTDNNVGQVFDNFNAGRGRGRLGQKNNF